MDYSDFPTEEKKPPVKLIAIIGGGVLLAIIIIVILVRVLSAPPEPFVLDELASGSSKADVCANADDKEDCKINLLKSESEKNGDTALCKTMEEVNKDDCIWGVANEKQDEKICKQIKNEDWALRCKDGINRTLALEQNKESFCDKIEDEQKKINCKDELAGPLTSQNCTERGETTEVCEMINTADEANTAQDSQICEKLSEPYIQSCKALVAIDDPDFDGIASEIEENLFGTDPRKKDTDNDGYSDLDEIEAGYDPTGPGKL